MTLKCERCALPHESTGNYQKYCSGCRLPAEKEWRLKNKERLQFLNIWHGMKSRCLNPNNISYKYYGARGITICKRWLSFDNFKKDMYPTFVPGLTLDRVNNNGNYNPKNCRWVNRQAQNNNKRNIKKFTLGTNSFTAAEWARRLGIKHHTLWMRLNSYDWTVEQALTRRVRL